MNLEARQKSERQSLTALRDAIRPDCSAEDLCKLLRRYDGIHCNPAQHFRDALSVYLATSSEAESQNGHA